MLALLLSVLMLAPPRAQAMTFQTGVGYVRGECRSLGTSDEKACLSGERFDLGLNVPVKGDDPGDKSGGAKASTSPSSGHGGGGNWLGGNWGSGGGREFAFIVVILLVVLVLYGIYWLIVGAFSKKLSMGLYASFDFQKGGIEGGDNYAVEKYHSQSTGIQTMFYLLREADFVLNVGVAGTTAQIKTSSAADGDSSYNLRGISSKAGLGYVPFETTGFYAMLEWEGTYFDGTSLSKYIREDGLGKLPQVRNTGALILGLAF